MKSIFGTFAITMALASCGNSDSINFSGVDPALTVPPTQIMVLGTTHLSNYSNELSPEDLNPLLDLSLIHIPSPRDRG